VLRIGVIMYQTSMSKGQELVAQRMVGEFRAQNYDAFLITSPYHDGAPVVSEEEIAAHGGFVHVFDERMGIPVIRVAGAPQTWPPRRIALRDFITTLGRIVDDLKLNVLIVHSTLWNGPEEVLKFIEWRRNLARDVFPQLTPVFCHMSHFQEASPERYEMAERTYREAWNETSLSQIVKGADLVLVVSPDEKQLMKEMGAAEERCFLFPGGIDEMKGGEEGEEAFLAKHQIPPGTKLVTSLGSVEERKNTMAVVEVARRLAGRPGVRFVIAGMEQGEYGRRVREEAGKVPNVLMLGAISEEEKASLIRASSMNIIMSRSEALGITQLEFMSNGVPVVSSGAGGQQWVVRDRRDGILLDGPDDIAGAARAISKLLDDGREQRKMGRSARRRAESYSMSRLVHSLAHRLERLTQERSDEESLRRGIPQEERVLEAMVSGPMRVVVTNRRLIVKKEEVNEAEPVSLPLAEIYGVTARTRYPWYVLAAGAAASAGLLAAVLGLSPLDRLIAQFAPSSLTAELVRSVLPIAPLAASLALFFRLRRRGYSVHANHDLLFLPEEFLRLLKLVDRITPRELFDDDDD
jgi:glycosyltransferase involved in cell wall biosynthesis